MPRVGLLIDTDVPEGHSITPADFAQHTVNLAVSADGAGFDGVFFPDRHMRESTYGPSQIVNATAAAVATHSVQIGTYCSVLPLYNPMEFAEAWAQVDQLSSGRTVVAVGAGYNEAYLRCYGIPRSGYRSRFEEATAVVKRAWSSTDVWSFKGEVFQFDDVSLLPGPFQTNGPPLWVAGQGEWAIDFAAAVGDGFAGDPFPIDVAVWIRRVNRFLEGAHARQVAHPEVAMLRHVYVSEDDHEARAVALETCLPHLRFYQDAGLLKGRIAEGTAVDEALALQTAVAGSADHCAESLVDIVDSYGLTYLLVKLLRPERFQPERELAMVRQLGEVLLPEIRRLSCSTS